MSDHHPNLLHSFPSASPVQIHVEPVQPVLVHPLTFTSCSSLQSFVSQKTFKQTRELLLSLLRSSV